MNPDTIVTVRLKESKNVELSLGLKSLSVNEVDASFDIFSSTC